MAKILQACFLNNFFVLHKVLLYVKTIIISKCSVYSFSLTRYVPHYFSFRRQRFLVSFKLHLGFISLCLSNGLIISLGTKTDLSANAHYVTLNLYFSNRTQIIKKQLLIFIAIGAVNVVPLVKMLR
jgi:hypothetical protein